LTLPVVVEPSPGQLTSAAGLLPIGEFDQRVGLSQTFAGDRDDLRDRDLTEHTFLEIVRSRVYAIVAAAIPPVPRRPAPTDGPAEPLGVVLVGGAEEEREWHVGAHKGSFSAKPSKRISR
jgi:hypothetical protein